MISSKKSVLYPTGQEVEVKKQNLTLKSESNPKGASGQLPVWLWFEWSFILCSITINYKLSFSRTTTFFSSGFPSNSLFKY